MRKLFVIFICVFATFNASYSSAFSMAQIQNMAAQLATINKNISALVVSGKILQRIPTPDLIEALKQDARLEEDLKIVNQIVASIRNGQSVNLGDIEKLVTDSVEKTTSASLLALGYGIAIVPLSTLLILFVLGGIQLDLEQGNFNTVEAYLTQIAQMTSDSPEAANIVPAK